MAFHPKLRPEVELALADGEPHLLDPLLGRLVSAGPVTRSLAEVMARSKGSKSVEEVLGEVAARVPGAERATIENSLRGLMLLTLIEGAGDGLRARIREMTTGATPIRPVFLAGTRFGCQGSGQCCRVYDVPVTEEDIERLSRFDLSSVAPELGPDVPFYELRTNPSNGASDTFLLRRESRCIFLKPGERCGLHAAFGPESKPNVCRVFPWRAMLTLDGMKVFDQGECASFAVSARTGDSIEAQLPTILPLLPKHPTFFHPICLLPDGTPIDHGWILDLQKKLVGLTAAPRPAAETFAMIVDCFRAWLDAMASCDLDEAGPERSHTRILERDPSPPASAAPRLEQIAALVHSCDGMIESYEQDTSLHGPLTEWCKDTLSAVRAIAAHRLDPAKHACPDSLLEAMALPLDPEIDEVLRLSFRGSLFGDGMLVQARIGSAALKLALTLLVTVVGARLNAYALHVPHVRATDLSFSHSAASTVFRRPLSESVLIAHEPLAWDVAAAVPALALGLSPPR